MVKKIITNLQISRDIVLTAQKLINEQFNDNAQIIIKRKRKENSLFNKKLHLFKKAMQESTLFSQQEKNEFTKLEETKVYQIAREIILSLLKQEIKPPYIKK